MAELKYAPIYFDARDKLALLPDDERGKLLLAILDYAMSAAQGETFTLDERYGLTLAGELSFHFMTDGIDRCYEVSKQRAENRKSKQSETKLNKIEQTITNPNKSKQKREDKDYDKDYEKEKDYIDTLNSFSIHYSTCTEPQEALVLELPLNDGSSFGVTEDMVSEWTGLYPAVDVMQQLRNMRGWLIANPDRKKTRKGIKRFINAWLSKAQDKGGNVVIKTQHSFMDAAADLERGII